MPGPTIEEHPDIVEMLRGAGVARSTPLALSVGRAGLGLSAGPANGSWHLATSDPVATVALIEATIGPRWTWWSPTTADLLTADGLRVGVCWDLAAVHRLLFGGWRAEPARIWAALKCLDLANAPTMGQLGLLDHPGDDGGDADDAVRGDGHLRPEWIDGAWSARPQSTVRWAEITWQCSDLQRRMLADLGISDVTARSESAAELLCAELRHDGLPVDRTTVEMLVATAIGPRPLSEADEAAARRRRDDEVLAHARMCSGVDLRNPAHVKAMLVSEGIDVPDTRAGRLEPYRQTNPLVDALLMWRKAERIATTYGYRWLDEHVATDGRLRGDWTACDGAAGRMTASAGLHNLPAAMRTAVCAEPGHVFVHADLGQIEPRVLAAVSGDDALAAATTADDLYAPIAQRLGVERSVAKVAVLGAMYGATTGTAAAALRGLETAYPVAMAFLREADRSGRAGIDLRTVGGRLVRMSRPGGQLDTSPAAAGARGRYARNAMIQGAAAELFKAWAATLRRRLAAAGNARIVMCLHDELLVHVTEDAADATATALEAALDEAAARWSPDSPVRYVAHATVIRRWSDAE